MKSRKHRTTSSFQFLGCMISDNLFLLQSFSENEFPIINFLACTCWKCILSPRLTTSGLSTPPSPPQPQAYQHPHPTPVPPNSHPHPQLPSPPPLNPAWRFCVPGSSSNSKEYDRLIKGQVATSQPIICGQNWVLWDGIVPAGAKGMPPWYVFYNAHWQKVSQRFRDGNTSTWGIGNSS